MAEETTNNINDNAAVASIDTINNNDESPPAPHPSLLSRNDDNNNHGVNVEANGFHGWTPLHSASYDGNTKWVKYLVDSGANVEAKTNDGKTPLIFASMNGQLPVVQYLVQDAGADVEATNNHGETPLICASNWGKLPVVQYLLEQAGAELEAPAADGTTALLYACAFGQRTVVQYLVETAGANVDAQDHNGRGALAHARGNGQAQVVQYLEQQEPRQQQQEPSAGVPNHPVLPEEPSFTSNQQELVANLEQWVQSVESILNTYLASVEQWKERQNQTCQERVQEINAEIARLETQKTTVEQTTQESVSKATNTAEAFAQQCQGKIAGTREIIGNLTGEPRAPQVNDPPSALCCPITLQLMEDPVIIVEDGHTYEHAAILEHWRTQEAQGIPITSPHTNQRLSSKQVTPNVLARSQCREWREQHPNWSL